MGQSVVEAHLWTSPPAPRSHCRWCHRLGWRCGKGSAHWSPSPDYFLMANNEVCQSGCFCKEIWVVFISWEWVGMMKTDASFWGDDKTLSLTSVNQPFPHCVSHIEGDPFSGSFGQHILGSDVALFPNVFIWPHNLQGKKTRSLKNT